MIIIILIILLLLLLLLLIIMIIPIMNITIIVHTHLSARHGGRQEDARQAPGKPTYYIT